MSASAHTLDSHHYFVPQPSKWPFVGSIAMVLFGYGAAGTVNGTAYGPYTLSAGFAVLIYMMYGWFHQVSIESETGQYGKNVDVSFRWSMGWFIFSEVMFFAGFFGALFYARAITLPWLSDLDHRAILWPDFAGNWPNSGPAGTIESFRTMGPWPIPTINTALLLTSGVTLTIAHHALKEGNRGLVKLWLAATVILGTVFVGFQAYEYAHAYSELNLKLTSGIYGSTFFMLTGFHGFHVCVGAIMLAVVWFRLMAGHFTPEHHFAFEAAAWYWHFVDVVWLGLYLIVYWM
ncbi:MAG: cytochrome c oxidase subunit 3 [Betaproteobacteria bacterium]|jgi:cytochrome c oxidase subunit 3|nr:cytochrome c oxidase subunit 3 [Betaproteobacteria bacterium]